MMVRVTKTDGFEAYTLRSEWEWATILIRSFRATGVDGEPREVGEILVHSSFGSWAYQWGHLGRPFKQWLAKGPEREYVASKFLGTMAYVFDGASTVRNLRRSLLENRRSTDITKDDARAIWDWINDYEGELEQDERSFVESMSDCMGSAVWESGARHFLEAPWERLANKLNPQFAGFWETFMPAFVDTIRQELAGASGLAVEVTP